MQVTLIENRQNYVHDKDGNEHQHHEIRSRVAKGQSLPLQTSPYIRGKNLLGALLNKIGGLTNGVAGFHVEEKRDTGELVDVVHRLWSQHRVRVSHRVQRNHALPVIALDIQLAQILRVGALSVSHLQNRVILIGSLFDQITVVLRIRVVQQRQDSRLGNSVQLG